MNHSLPQADGGGRTSGFELPTPTERRVLDDRATVVLAAITWFGALHPHPIPVAAGAIIATVALNRRRPWLLGLGLLLLASALAQRAHDGLEPPASASFDGIVTLVSDPIDTGFGMRVDVKSGGRRYELRTTGAPSGALGTASAGERVRVVGRIGPSPPDSPWLIPRHVAGRMTARRIERHDPGNALHRGANRFRRLLQRGAEPMGEPTRSLFGGFVLGDERGQTPEIADDFLGSGLTHLLVVSGSNVAFLLVLISPLTNRLGLGARWATTILVIAAFALVTRFEPSVLRASVMAAISVTGGLLGRPATGLRMLALAVTGLLLIDPLLAHATAFQLSVGASLGIIVTGTWIGERLPGPRWFREIAAMTAGAQIGVLPVLISRFGGVPVAALPANLLAVPAAGLITTWGLPAALVGGIVGDPIGPVLQQPTAWLIQWIAAIARLTSAAPLGDLGVRHSVVASLCGAAALGLRGRASPHRLLQHALAVTTALALLAPAIALRSPPTAVEVTGGGRLYRSGGATVLVLDRRPHPAGLLETLRRTGVRRIDLLVWTRRPDRSTVIALHHRWPVDHQLTTDDPATSVRIGDLVVTAGGGTAPEVRAPFDTS